MFIVFCSKKMSFWIRFGSTHVLRTVPVGNVPYRFSLFKFVLFENLDFQKNS